MNHCIHTSSVQDRSQLHRNAVFNKQYGLSNCANRDSYDVKLTGSRTIYCIVP